MYLIGERFRSQILRRAQVHSKGLEHFQHSCDRQIRRTTAILLRSSSEYEETRWHVLPSGSRICFLKWVEIQNLNLKNINKIRLRTVSVHKYGSKVDILGAQMLIVPLRIEAITYSASTCTTRQRQRAVLHFLQCNKHVSRTVQPHRRMHHCCSLRFPLFFFCFCSRMDKIFTHRAHGYLRILILCAN